MRRDDALTEPIQDVIPGKLQQSDAAKEKYCDSLNDELIDAFLSDFTIESSDRSVSRGFLDGVRSLLTLSGGSSDLASAMRMIALASGRGVRGKQRAQTESKAIYVELLKTVREDLAVAKNLSNQSLVMIVLLGIYEVSRGAAWGHFVDNS